MTDYVVSPRRAPVWDGLPEAERLLLERANGQPLTGGGDREDTLEEVARLKAAIRAVPEGYLWVELPREGWGAALTGAWNWSTGATANADETALMDSIGSVPNTHSNYAYLKDSRFTSARFVDTYYDSPVFHRHAGRSVVRATAGDEPGGFPTVEDAIDGVGTPLAFLKAAQSKLAVFETPSPYVSSDFFAKIPMSALDVPGGLLVQPYIPMHNEYRIFVVDHQIVTGAGNIESHTPLDNTARMDPVMEYTRGDGTPRPAPEVLKQHVELAERVVADWRLEHPEHGLYVLDVATGPDGSSLVVEFNSLNNAGLFATDVDALFEAWVQYLAC